MENLVKDFIKGSSKKAVSLRKECWKICVSLDKKAQLAEIKNAHTEVNNRKSAMEAIILMTEEMCIAHKGLRNVLERSLEAIQNNLYFLNDQIDKANAPHLS